MSTEDVAPDAAGQEPARPTRARPNYENLPKSSRRKLLRQAILRPVLTAMILVLVYFLVPMKDLESIGDYATLLLPLAVAIAVFAWQVHSTAAARYPLLRGIEALAIAVPTYLLGFASTYLVMSSIAVDSFNESLSRLDALYFTMVCFATVGFGDIVAHSEVARAVVTIQIATNLVLLGFGIKIVSAAVRVGQRRNDGTQADR